MCNLNHIEIMSKKIKPFIIFCSEARVTNEISDEIKIDGYNEIICASNSRFTGGVVIYARNNLKLKIICTNAIENTLWYLTIEIIDSHVNGIYSVFL